MTVVDWLLDSDPAIRWQVLRDLLAAPDDVVKAERSRVVTEGWGARLLGVRGADGQWEGGAHFPADGVDPGDGSQPWTATAYSLLLLRDFGIDPGCPQARVAIDLIKENCRWENDGQPFFAGEVEPCINGMTVALGVYFNQPMEKVVTRLLGDQLVDGGWNFRVRSKQQPDGTWLLENTHPGAVHFNLEAGDGQPSRWNTLRALRVLQWHEYSSD